MELYEQLPPGWDQQAQPMTQPVMAGTADPAQLQQQKKQKMMIDALRSVAPAQAQPAQGGANRVVPAGGNTAGSVMQGAQLAQMFM